jgi:hypothetical protein
VIMEEKAQDLAEWIDSNILLDIFVECGKKFDNAKMPLICRYVYDPEKNEIVRAD